MSTYFSNSDPDLYILFVISAIKLHKACFRTDLPPKTSLSTLNLLLQNLLERDGISREFRNTFSEFLDGHGLLVEVEPEQRFVVEVRFLGDLEGCGVLGVELLGDFFGGVVEGFKEGGLF